MRARDEGAFPIRYFWNFLPDLPDERAFCVEKMALLFVRGVTEGWVDLTVDEQTEEDGRALYEVFLAFEPEEQKP